MTLIELTVVLLILIALAGLAMPYLSGTSRASLCKATDVTMLNIKKAIMNGYYQDTLGYFPVDKGVGNDYSLHYLFARDDGIDNDGDGEIDNGGSTLDPEDAWQPFDPETAVGWRGPYLMNGKTLSAADIAKLSDTFKDSADLTPHVHYDLAVGTVAVMDGWGRPIIIQNSPSGFRLVSAGPGSGLGMANVNGNPNADIETAITGDLSGDDRILYLNAATPATDVNSSCD